MPSNRRPMGGRGAVTRPVSPRWSGVNAVLVAPSPNGILADPTPRQPTPEQVREAEQAIAQWDSPTTREMIESMWNYAGPVYFPPPTFTPSPPPDPESVSPAQLRSSGRGIIYSFDGSGVVTITADNMAATQDLRRPRSQRPPEPANTPGSFRRMYRLVRDMGVELCR